MPYLSENFDRNALWTIKKYPALADVSNSSTYDVQRMLKTFDATQVSMKLLMFHVYFFTNVARPEGKKREREEEEKRKGSKEKGKGRRKGEGGREREERKGSEREERSKGREEEERRAKEGIGKWKGREEKGRRTRNKSLILFFSLSLL